MGEVSFAAVLRWVTRVDDFTKLCAIHLSEKGFCTLNAMRNLHLLS